MATLTNSIKQRFVKDYNLPINIFEDEVFNYFIDLYDRTHKTKEKYELLKETVDILNGEEGFFKEFESIKTKIIEEISQKKAYKVLSETTNWTRKFMFHDINMDSKNIYQPIFHNKIIISLDLIKANFNCFRIFNPELVNNAATYEEFISKYTRLNYFKQSKQLRQIIFGNLLPKKQQQIQKCIINHISNWIVVDNCELEDHVFVNGTDEILILNQCNEVLPEDISPDINSFSITSVLKRLPEYNDILNISIFRLIQIHPEKSFYVKEHLYEDKIEFKQVPSIFFPQVFKYYFKLLPVCYNDLLFYHEGQKATFTTPLF
jgi:hypothetical protein